MIAQVLCTLLVLGQWSLPLAPAAGSAQPLINAGLSHLLRTQKYDGSWSYEGVYRVAGNIPVGYQVGGTAVVCSCLLSAGLDGNRERAAAFNRGIDFILANLDDPLMRPSRAARYDVRVWGQTYALQVLCHLRALQPEDPRREVIDGAVAHLVRTLVHEEIDGGGWNYANRRRAASFVTAPVLQALLLAAAQQERVPEEVLDRGRETLLAARLESGAYIYSGKAADLRANRRPPQVPGSIARALLCDVTLLLLGAATTADLQRGLDYFHEHWDHLEARRKQSGTHKPPYGIAPYYFYFGHRYAAQAITLLPYASRQREQQRLAAVTLKTRDPDGSWNDRVFEQSSSYGTAMAVLTLLGDRVLPPPPRSRLVHRPTTPVP